MVEVVLIVEYIKSNIIKYLDWDDIFHKQLIFKYFDSLVSVILFTSEKFKNKDYYYEHYYDGMRRLLKENYVCESSISLGFDYKSITLFYFLLTIKR